MSNSDDPTTETGVGGPDIRITAGTPTPAEVAAVTAVLTAVLDEMAAAEATRAVSSTTAWQRSQRSLRGPLTPGAGGWRSFSA